jgi:hypothetical protein
MEPVENYNEKTVLYAFRICVYHLIKKAIKDTRQDKSIAIDYIKQLDELGETRLKVVVDFFVSNIAPQLPKRIMVQFGYFDNFESLGKPLKGNLESVYTDCMRKCERCNITAECVAFTNRVISFVQCTEEAVAHELMQRFALDKIRLFCLIECYKSGTERFPGNEKTGICGTREEESPGTFREILLKQFTCTNEDIVDLSRDELKDILEFELPNSSEKRVPPQIELYNELDETYQKLIRKFINKGKIIAVIIALLSVAACVVGGLLIGKIFNIGLNALVSQIIQYGILAIGVVGLVVDAICNSNRIKKSINRIRKSIGGCLCCNIDEQLAPDLHETIHTTLSHEQ